MTRDSREPRRRPTLPLPRGDISHHVIDTLRGATATPGIGSLPRTTDPYGDDLQLALYVLYEMHYQGFTGVRDELEWDADLLALRGQLEARFHHALRADVPSQADADAALAPLLLEPVGHDESSVTHFLQRDGTAEQLREYAALRSLYHLKEADPHAWVIPRLRGRAKAGMVAVEFDEFGAGRPENIHAQLFADLMTDLGLEPGYGHYTDAAPAQALATVNVMSLFGLHRVLRGALVGHFAAVEVTSSPGSRRLAAALRRTGAGAAATHFYDEHVEADAVHEQVVRREVVAGLLSDEPELAPDVAHGVDATVFLEERLARRLLGAWRNGLSALRTPLDPAPARPTPRHTTASAPRGWAPGPAGRNS
ncbi:iron-containing redox enzyme family protein [Streptomyces sp. A475]|uniref:iron-containing redox enzyme family protein n=1 Tax=Streptomyces sp. A475 TaxID=3131976 RepID=UPI0030C95819